MTIKQTCLLSAWILLAASGVARSEPTWHVSPRGSDANAGSRDKPFLTLQRARDALRQSKVAEPKRIVLGGGAYFDVAVTLEAEDSGLTIEAAPGETPRLYGGIRLSGWQQEGDYYVASLPARSDGRNWEIRMLQVDGKMAPRARYPAKDTLTHLSTFEVPWMSTTGGGWKRKPTVEELTTLKYKQGDIRPWLETQNAEVTVYHMWDESVVGVAANDVKQGVLTFSSQTGHPPGAFKVDKFVVWNIREGMKAPGQWYHDRTRNRVVYWPLPGQDMSRAEVIAPTTTTILRLRGTAEKPIRNVTLRGLTLSVTTVPLRAAGFAAAAYDGAISLEDSENCVIDNVTVTRVAGHGISSRKGCRTARVANCEVASCGGGGIYVGGTKAVITNNHVHGVGLCYPSAIGIFRSGQECVISHNEVHDCTYSAISSGGQGTIFEDNLIYDCMKELHDGAAIYVFGAKNCIIRRNVARDIIDTGGYGASAYYLDEQSEGCLVEGNLSLSVNRPTHNHMARNNTIRHNVFIVAGDAKLTFPKSSDFTFEGNVLYVVGKIRIENVSAVTVWSKNVLFSQAGRVEGTVMSPDNRYLRTEFTAPGDSVTGDPLFMDWKNGDYRYQPGSPAQKLGLPAIDPSGAGRLKVDP